MIQLDVSIMGQGYRLACREGEEKMLREAVAYLDEKMCSIRDGGKIKGNDRIAVMGDRCRIAGDKIAEWSFVRNVDVRNQAENGDDESCSGSSVDAAGRPFLIPYKLLTNISVLKVDRCSHSGRLNLPCGARDLPYIL